MLKITEKEILARFAVENPWWQGGVEAIIEAKSPKRAYFQHFYRLVTSPIKRAPILMGPRRVGKTFMMRQVIASLIQEKEVPASNLLYVSLNTPLYTGIHLEKLLTLFLTRDSFDQNAPSFIFFDEIQYLENWELHLKSLVDFYPNIKFIASGSAAAALKKKSIESGAGRFTDFLLPPLNFLEFMAFSDGLEVQDAFDKCRYYEDNIDGTNTKFLEYLNYGGFPEAVLTKEVQDNFRQFIGDDIIDKVLNKDLPELYGIRDTQELNRLFTVLAFNTGHEISLEELAGAFEAKEAGEASKNTVKKYLEYLEAAFLIKRVYRIDQNAKRLKKQYHFKVYITNPSMRAALFGRLEKEDVNLGAVVETAVFNHRHLLSSSHSIHYTRWAKGEIDFVEFDDARQLPVSLMEVTWSDKKLSQKKETLRDYAEKHKIKNKNVTLLTYRQYDETEDSITLVPVSLWCFIDGMKLYNQQLSEATNVLDEGIEVLKMKISEISSCNKE